MPDKGAALNERVWQLFERAGFETKPNSNNPAEETVILPPGRPRTLDLYATDPNLGIKIIGWNKARRHLGESFSVHVNDYTEVQRQVGAQAVLYVATEMEITDLDREYARQNGGFVWGSEELDYYDALVDAIGKYAKYELVNSLGIATNEERNTQVVPAFKLHQPTSNSPAELFMFTMSPGWLLKTCAVFRRARGNKEAYQRILRKSRLAGIQKFVTRPDSLLPPNIIVHLSDNVTWQPLTMPATTPDGRTRISISRPNSCELGLLNIPLQYASMELIDGQHRLYGFLNTDPATRDYFNLVVVGMKNVSPKRRTETFIAINDNARRIDPNLVAYLKLNEDEAVCQQHPELMAIKVVYELNRTTPFKGRIRLLDVGDERITLKNFSGYDLKVLVGPKGQLRKYYSNESASYTRALRLYFNIVRSLFPEQYADPEKYILFTNRGISALLKLLKSILKTEQMPISADVVRHYMTPLTRLPMSRWEVAKLPYVGAKGWKDFHRELVGTIRERSQKFKE